MNSSKFRVVVLMTLMLALVSACNIPGAGTQSEPIATEEISESVEVTEAAPHADAAPAIQHTTIPASLPENQSGQALDFNASKVLENKTPIGGDRFTFGRFERPFNANTMDVYFSQLDIVNTMVFQDDTWIYTSITLQDLQQSSMEGVKYAVEIDANLNGKGDWLIIAGQPASTDWTVSGVQVYKDANQDVGGEMPMLTDEVKVENDGFETMVFDQGQGDDPDTAWVRISPSDPNTVQFALKKSALETPTKYLINMWAGTELLSPEKFDLNDRFTHEQAGAADAGLNVFYPIKGVAEIDNSCRMAVGFQPTGKEPGLCAVFIPQNFADPVSPSGPSACVQQTCGAEYTWNPVNCSCEYSGPR